MLKHSTAQHSTAQHSTAQHSTAQHSTAQVDCALFWLFGNDKKHMCNNETEQAVWLALSRFVIEEKGGRKNYEEN
jgi:type I restriction enzyme M protein